MPIPSAPPTSPSLPLELPLSLFPTQVRRPFSHSDCRYSMANLRSSAQARRINKRPIAAEVEIPFDPIGAPELPSMQPLDGEPINNCLRSYTLSDLGAQERASRIQARSQHHHGSEADSRAPARACAEKGFAQLCGDADFVWPVPSIFLVSCSCNPMHSCVLQPVEFVRALPMSRRSRL